MRKTRKKFGIVMPTHWAARMGGAEYQASILLEELIRRDQYRIFYLARQVNTSFHPVNYTIVKVGDIGGIRRYTFFFDAIKILKALNRIRPDIIYQGVGCSYTGIVAYYTRHNETKMIWQIESDADVTPLEYNLTSDIAFRFLEKKFLEYGIANADRIVAQTENQSKLLQKNYRRIPTAVIRNFHLPPKEELKKTNPTKILWIANLKSLKQPELFVNLARDLKNFDQVQFLMIGKPGRDRRAHTGFLHQVSTLDNLTYLGERRQEEVNAFLANAHILVNTSTYEGFPNTFIQAWMRKVPVVSLNVNPDSILTDYGIGFCSGAYEKTRKDVIRLIKNAELRESMGARAQAYAFDKHSKKNIDELIRLFNF